MDETKPQCPEFPNFGAAYPDATCIDGVLWDLDSCDENGLISTGDNPPCPFCNFKDFAEYHRDLSLGVTNRTIRRWVTDIAMKYGSKKFIEWYNKKYNKSKVSKATNAPTE